MKNLSIKKQAGFTLVEFMVAMAITLVVLAATVAAFRDAAKTNQRVTLKSDMSDNLRAGFNLLQEDILQAGTGIPTGGISIPSFTGSGACGFAADGSALPVPAVINRPASPPTTLVFPPCNVILPAVEPGMDRGPFITSPDATSTTNTDTISVLYADNTLGLNQNLINAPAIGANPGCPLGTISPTGNSATFDSTCVSFASFTANDVQISPGDLIMFSNARGNAIQTVTAVGALTLTFSAGDAFNFNGTGAPFGTIRNLQNIDALGNPNGTYPPTTLTRIWMITYYLSNYLNGVPDPAHVFLVRRVNFNAGQPVGETLENLQFTYNFSDGIAVNQGTVPVNYSENQIRAVNVTLAARSVDPIPVGNKMTYLRSNFQTQVSVRSLSYFNKYQ
jgi:prepilin-type N-terminal cleavage/methylation domain-containing protein